MSTQATNLLSPGIQSIDLNGVTQRYHVHGRQCGIDVSPHRFRRHFSHTWLDHGGAEGDPAA
jgi:hypothetical protein